MTLRKLPPYGQEAALGAGFRSLSGRVYGYTG